VKNETHEGTVRVVTTPEKKVYAKEWLAVQLIRETEYELDFAIEKRDEYETLLKHCELSLKEALGKLESAIVLPNSKSREYNVTRLSRQAVVLKKSFELFSNEFEIWNCTVDELMT